MQTRRSSATVENAFPLITAQSADIDALMSWFPDQASVANWGGPNFRHPFNRETFREDCRWQTMASFVLRDEDTLQLGFGQLYERSGRTHLARISVNPEHRRRGIGQILVRKLMEEGERLLGLPDFSLFVLTDNPVACRLYTSLGFTIAEFPKGAPMRYICYYMTRNKLSSD
jgi:ribosomal protein S18 acetylase RimI-like enzyme